MESPVDINGKRVIEWSRKRKLRAIAPERIERLVALLRNRGFVHDDTAAWLLGGWTRYYNLNRAESQRDWTGKYAPRIYSVGACGVQIEWWTRDNGDTCTECALWRTWRN